MSRLVIEAPNLLTVLAVSALVTLVMTPLLRNVSRKAGWLDQPDGTRKMHRLAVPPSGGVAIMLGLLAGGAFSAAVPPMLWVGAALVVAAGIADDRRNLRPWQKLLPQAVASALVVYGALPATNVFGALAAIFWLLLCANAFNLFDGMDGLATAAGLIAAAAMLCLRPAAAGVLAPLAGSLAAFLIFNLPPASVFLGDSGSLLAGFLLGWAALAGEPWGKLPAPVLVLALPLADTAFTFGRRLVRGQPVFQADRAHLHHHLLRCVGSPRAALLWLTAVSIVTALAGIALGRAQ